MSVAFDVSPSPSENVAFPSVPSPPPPFSVWSPPMYGSIDYNKHYVVVRLVDWKY